MKLANRPAMTLVLAILMLVGLFFIPDMALATDPPLLDPTLSPPVNAYVATPYQWAQAMSLLSTMYPDATYLQLCQLAYSWFGMLPPALAPAYSPTPYPYSPHP
jgi:hypothetical protein